MKKFKYVLTSVFAVVMLCGCDGFLDQEPDGIYTDDQVFTDQNMLISVLSNLYGRVNYGINLDDSYSFTYIDEAAKMEGGPDYLQTYDDNLFREYHYGFVRNCNQFLEGKITGVAADVFSQESELTDYLRANDFTGCQNENILAAKEIIDEALARKSNFYVQPHQGFNSDIAAKTKAAEAMNHVVFWLNNGKDHFKEQLPYYT